MATVDVRLKFEAGQLAALDNYRDFLYRQYGIRVSRSQTIRDMIGKQLRDAGFEWPDDPQLGGDRRSGQHKEE
jgi:1,2-phenylacetyl-CoA epoxidase catalytic subunit